MRKYFLLVLVANDVLAVGRFSSSESVLETLQGLGEPTLLIYFEVLVI